MRIVRSIVTYSLICVLLLPACTSITPVYHDFSEVEDLRKGLDAQQIFHVDDIEKLHGGEYIYRIDYLNDNHLYTLELRTFDTATGKFNPPKRWHDMAFFYEDNVLLGAIELLKEERSERFLINECLFDTLAQDGCLEHFTGKMKAQFLSSRIVLQEDRYEPLLKKRQYITEGESNDQPPKIHLLWAVPLSFVVQTAIFGIALFTAPVTVPVLATMESNRVSEWKSFVETTELNTGDNTFERLTTLQGLPSSVQLITYIDGGTYYLYDRPAISFGVKNETIIWVRRCRYYSPSPAQDCSEPVFLD